MTTKYINFTEEFEQEVKQELELKEQAARQKTSKNLTGRTYNKIIRLMMHGQLHDIVKPNDKNKKGVVVAFACKSDMNKKLAKTVHTLQQLISGQPTHFSQGAYPAGLIKRDRKGTTWGFTKENLNQINFIFVDVDDQKRTPTEIVDWSRLNGLTVNLIVRTDKGYQVYFVFKEALYLNGKKKQWILNSADQTANNVKEMMKEGGFNVDMGCVNYQICRFPRKDYIVYYNFDRLDDYDFYAKWSVKRTETSRLPRKNGVRGANFTLVKGNLPGWARALVGCTTIKQGDRNTALYTVSLAYRDAGIPLEQALIELTNWMDPRGLRRSDIKRTIESAYQHEFHARKEFFEPLLREYNLSVDYVRQIDWNKLTEAQKKRYWAHVKPAKPRSARQRIHASEYAEDLLQLAKENNGKIAGTKKELMEQLGLNPGNNKPLDRAIKLIEDRDDVNIQKSRRNRNELVLTIMLGAEKPKEQEQPLMTSTKKPHQKQMTKQELQKTIALSVVGPVSERESHRERAVKMIGTVAYGKLLAAFITDPEAFMGGAEKLNEVRQTG